MKHNLFILSVALVMFQTFVSCNTNKGNNPDNPKSEESAVQSTSSQNNGNGIIIESVMKDNTRQYYKIISPKEVGITNYYAYYASNGFKDYDYKGYVTIPETITHEGTTYSVTCVLGGGSKNDSERIYSAFYNSTELKGVTLPSTINKIETCAMNLMKEYVPGHEYVNDFTLTCLSTTPPEMGQQSPDLPQPVGWDWKFAYATIKVPASSLEQYKAAWKGYNDHIFAID